MNASDERGIDIIRNQINYFVNSKPLFNTGMKFVILDEVDYMTKNAQQALRYLLQNYSKNSLPALPLSPNCSALTLAALFSSASFRQHYSSVPWIG